MAACYERKARTNVPWDSLKDPQTNEGYYEATSQIVLGHSRASSCRHGGWAWGPRLVFTDVSSHFASNQCVVLAKTPSRAGVCSKLSPQVVQTERARAWLCPRLSKPTRTKIGCPQALKPSRRYGCEVQILGNTICRIKTKEVLIVHNSIIPWAPEFDVDFAQDPHHHPRRKTSISLGETPPRSILHHCEQDTTRTCSSLRSCASQAHPATATRLATAH